MTVFEDITLLMFLKSPSQQLYQLILNLTAAFTRPVNPLNLTTNFTVAKRL